MLAFLLRFVIAGSIIALLPIVANRFGPSVAGLMLLIPAITLIGYAFLGAEGGSAVVQQASLASIWGIITVGAFIGTVYLVVRSTGGVALALSLGFAAWIIMTFIIYWFALRAS